MHIVWAHRIILILVCISCTTIYCTKGYSVCRPIPLRNYLQGSPSIGKYAREPVSAIVTLCFILLIVIMQICIEIKRRRDQKRDEVIVLMAVNAEKNLTNARLNLQQQDLHSTSTINQVFNCNCYI